MSSTHHAWRLIIYSSAITICGSLVIYADILWYWITGRKFSILKNRQFLVASLALSAGVLLTTALNSLLNNSQKYFKKGGQSKLQSDRALLASLITGFAVCLALNFLIHTVTSKSIVHCAHEGMDEGHSHDHSHDHSHEQPLDHDHSHTHDHSHEHEHEQYTETTPLRRPTMRQFVSGDDTLQPRSLIDKLQKQVSEGECRGFDSLYHCAAEIHINSSHLPEVTPVVNLEVADLSHHSHSEGDRVHHHHIVSRNSHLLSIGLQTALAITLHKFPEGFLLFATGRQDKEIGWNVFVALAVHNFFEGFTIACPLYLALENRALAVVCAAVLSGGTQPLGALVAALIFRHPLTAANFSHFGFLIGSTAGFMTIISLQMLCTAVDFGGSSPQVVMWTILGIITVLATRCI